MPKVLDAGAVLLLLAIPISGTPVELNLPRVSQQASISQRVGLTDIVIRYSRPAVRGRRVWGELIPYGIVWRTGANEATTITFNSDVSVAGSKLPAGTYSLHSILSKDEWTIIFNKIARQWGSFEYDPTQDALRISVKPQTADYAELLTFSFPRVTESTADVEFHWERVKVVFTLEVNTVSRALANARTAVAQAKATDWETPFRAAEYAFERDLVPGEAMQWIEQSIAAGERFGNLVLKARMLARVGKTRDAAAIARRAIEIAQSSSPKIDLTPLEQMLADWEKMTNQH